MQRLERIGMSYHSKDGGKGDTTRGSQKDYVKGYSGINWGRKPEEKPVLKKVDNEKGSKSV